MALPPFPVDDATLDLLTAAMDPRGHGDPEAESSSVWPFLTMLSQLGGSDTEAVKEVTDDGIHVMRDPHYHDHDVIAALVAEVRRLRALLDPGTLPMSRVRMFVFPFGSGDYDRQCAVVMAETAEDARRLLLADIERQRAACPHTDREESHWCERKGENGFSRGYFTADRLVEAAVAAAEGSGSDMAPFEVVGTVAYTWGVDG